MKSFVLLFSVLALSFYGCGQKNRINTSRMTKTPPPGGTVNAPPPPPGNVVAPTGTNQGPNISPAPRDQHQDPSLHKGVYTSPLITAMGNRDGERTTGPFWSSSWLSQEEQTQNFTTDGILKIRFLAEDPPPYNAQATVYDPRAPSGFTFKSCSLAKPKQYPKLKNIRLRIGVKRPGEKTYTGERLYNITPIRNDANNVYNNASVDYTFTVPNNNGVFVVEVTGADWDYTCNVSGDIKPHKCPVDPIYQDHCFRFKIQMITSKTVGEFSITEFNQQK